MSLYVNNTYHDTKHPTSNQVNFKYQSPKRYKLDKQSAEDDVIDRDEKQLYHIPNASHNDESQSA